MSAIKQNVGRATFLAIVLVFAACGKIIPKAPEVSEPADFGARDAVGRSTRVTGISRLPTFGTWPGLAQPDAAGQLTTAITKLTDAMVQSEADLKRDQEAFSQNQKDQVLRLKVLRDQMDAHAQQMTLSYLKLQQILANATSH